MGRSELLLQEVDEGGADNRPWLKRSLPVHEEDGETPVRGWDGMRMRNVGEPTLLHVAVRYAAFLRPKDLMASYLVGHSTSTFPQSVLCMQLCGDVGRVVRRSHCSPSQYQCALVRCRRFQHLLTTATRKCSAQSHKCWLTLMRASGQRFNTLNEDARTSLLVSCHRASPGRELNTPGR